MAKKDIFCYYRTHAGVAQLVEHSTDTRKVLGSIPSARTNMAQEIPGAHLVGDFGQKALIIKDGKVLMCRGVGDANWDFPGGRLHTGEDLAQGLRRELMEELGVDTEVEDPFFVTVWYGSRSGMPRVLVLYLVSLVNPAAEFSIAHDELEEVRWINKDEIETIGAAPEWKPALYKFFAAQSFVRKPRPSEMP